MGKFTKIPSEIKSFFKEKRLPAVVSDFTALLDTLEMDNRSLGGVKRDNCKLTNFQVFQILLLLPFFAVKGFSHYASSVMSGMFGGNKDILYSFSAQDNINWRNIVYRITTGLLSRTAVGEAPGKGKEGGKGNKGRRPSVLIADDTDLPKTGRCIELIGKVFSHVHGKCILGVKCLMLCWSDGVTQYMLDMSLHGEKGKVDGKEQGLSAKERERRYTRQRDAKSHTAHRRGEYFMGKGKKLMEMVRRAIRARVQFEYLLVDSWFTCTDLVDFVCKSRRPFHLLGMARLGNTKYTTAEWGELSAKAILARLKAAKSMRYSRRHRCHHATVKATLGGHDVRLFFCRMGRNEKWRLLLTTDTSLDFLKAYEIYAMRWSIEVFFADSKRLLGLADCSARDFSSQIAHVSLVMIRYNLLAFIKRANDYETLGGVFGDMYSGVHELTVAEKIWDIILDVVCAVAELTGMDDEVLLELIIRDNSRLAHFQALAKTA